MVGDGGRWWEMVGDGGEMHTQRTHADEIVLEILRILEEQLDGLLAHARGVGGDLEGGVHAGKGERGS